MKIGRFINVLRWVEEFNSSRLFDACEKKGDMTITEYEKNRLHTYLNILSAVIRNSNETFPTLDSDGRPCETITGKDDKFIEINFDQTVATQHQIYPLTAIKTVYIDLPDKKAIVFDLDDNLKGNCKRKELFASTEDCMKRWRQIEAIFDVYPANCVKDPDSEV